jgi:hypothetical protein
MSYEGGYTSAVNSISTRDAQDAGTDALRQRMAVLLQDFKDEQEDRAENKRLEPGTMKALEQMWGATGGAPSFGPQPPPPGQASVPMLPPGPPPPMTPPGADAMPGRPMPMPGAGGSAAQLMSMSAQGAPMGAPPPAAAPPMAAPQPPPQPQGWQPSPAATPALGGPPSGAAPAGPLPGGAMPGGGLPPMTGGPMGMASGGAGAPAAAPGGAPGGAHGELPPQWLSVPNAVAAMDKAGVPKSDQYRTLMKMMPVIEKQNKEAVQQLGTELRLAQAMNHAREQELRRIREEKEKPTALMKNAKAVAEGAPGASLIEGKLKKDATLSKGQRAGSVAGSAPGSLGGYGASYEKMTPRQQATVDWYATMQLGGDTTWRVGLSRIKGGSELIKAVDERVPERATELGLSAADVGTNKAIRVSTQAALTANTKDLATLKPYANMLDQNAEILKGLAAKAIKTDAALANRPINWLRTNATDNPDVADFLAQMEIVKNEATRVISNPRLVGQMTDTARQEIETVINGTMPLEATTRVLERLQNDSQRRVTTMEAQQTALQGTLKEMFPGGDGKKSAPAEGKPREFKTEAEAEAAGLEPGTRVVIGGKPGTWQ